MVEKLSIGDSYKIWGCSSVWENASLALKRSLVQVQSAPHLIGNNELDELLDSKRFS